jgi:hypothetical protein
VKVNKSTSINLSSSLTEHKENVGNCGHGMGQVQASGGAKQVIGIRTSPIDYWISDGNTTAILNICREKKESIPSFRLSRENTKQTMITEICNS